MGEYDEAGGFGRECVEGVEGGGEVVGRETIEKGGGGRGQRKVRGRDGVWRFGN